MFSPVGAKEHPAATTQRDDETVEVAAFNGCGKTASEEHEVSGHELTRAANAAN
jgi:hypothetical protein